MINNDREYWVQLLEKLNNTEDLYGLLGEVLAELCEYFGFGAGFIYQADYTGALYPVGSHSVYKMRLPRMLELEKLLTEEELESLSHRKTIAFRENTDKDSLQQKLGEIFEAKSMVLVPIAGQHGELLAFVGIMDRRGELRHPEEDMAFTTAVLTTLASFYKTQMYQQRVENTQKSLESILDHMGVDVYVNDFDTHEVLYANESMAAPYGGKDKLVGHICWQALYQGKTGECDYCPQSHLLDEYGRPSKMYSWDYQRPFDGSWFRVLSGAFPWVDGRLAHIVSSVDISDNKRNEDIIRRMAEYDHLTGLPNRFRLTNDFDAMLPVFKEKGQDGYILFMDLDGFKKVNDAMGHDAGDEILQRVGQLLQASPLTKNRSYRYGGDEFVILWDKSAPGGIMDVVDYLLQSFAEPWRLEEGEVKCGASIGISHYPYDSTLSSNLLRQADQAMYESKREMKGSVHFYNQGNICPPKEYFDQLAARQPKCE